MDEMVRSAADGAPDAGHNSLLLQTWEPEMFFPPQYFWLEPVIVAAVVVFVIDLIGNTLSFSNRFLNALVTSIVFALVFGSLVYFGYGNIAMSVSSTPSVTAPAKR